MKQDRVAGRSTGFLRAPEADGLEQKGSATPIGKTTTHARRDDGKEDRGRDEQSNEERRPNEMKRGFGPGDVHHHRLDAGHPNPAHADAALMTSAAGTWMEIRPKGRGG